MVANIRMCIAVLLASAFVTCIPQAKTNDKHRNQKSLQFFDYYDPELNYELLHDDFETDNDDPSSRALPTKHYSNRLDSQYNSPIYYIRLPPQPYMYIPNLGYVSRPPSQPLNQFLNLPVSFVANGKPSQIYQWNGRPVPKPVTTTTTTTTTPKPMTQADSAIHRLPGKYSFNGKPNGIYVLNDPYNALYADALEHFYP